MPPSNKPTRGQVRPLAPLNKPPAEPDRAALHPLRSDAPDQKGCNAYRSGAPPPTTSPTAGNSSPQTPTVRLGRSHTASTCSPRLQTRGTAPVTSRCTRSEEVQCLRIGRTTSSTTSLRVGVVAGTAHAGTQQAQAVQRCTRYDSNALDRRALHYLLSSATLR